eukprot:286561-Hanusia_phi.AAC.1
MQAFCLRRTKAILSSSLPPLSIQTHTVRLHGHHLDMYNMLFDSASSAFFALDEHGGAAVMRRYSSVLECILRLRQTCCSSRGVPQQRMERARQVMRFMEEKRRLQEGGAEENCTKLLNQEEASRMLEKLSGKEEDMECVVCLEDLEEQTKRVIRSCYHCFCEDCILKLLELAPGGQAVCPLCRQAFARSDVYSKQQTQEAHQNLGRNSSEQGDGEEQEEENQEERGEGEEEKEESLSPKIHALLLDLQEALQADATVKSVVFSNFLSCLDEAEGAILAAGIPVFRIDGRTSIIQRRKLIEAFEASPVGAALLISTKVGESQALAVAPSSFPSSSSAAPSFS